jgi:hypothetical protein
MRCNTSVPVRGTDWANAGVPAHSAMVSADAKHERFIDGSSAL